MKKTACVVTLGCKANQFESAAMEQQLVSCGYQLCPFEQGAELVVVNSCTVTAATDVQTRKLIRRARRFNRDCRIVVTGCYAQINPQQLAALPEVSLVFGNMEKQNFIRLLHNSTPDGAGSHTGNIVPGDKIMVGDIARASSCPDLHIASFAEHSRAFVQIQSGCDAFCSYCIIPFARGRSRSVTADAVIGQIKALVENGYQEVVLTGIHIGNYGRDLSVQITLADLVESILNNTELHRLRLGSVEPLELSDGLIDVVCDNERVCPHLHIPLQSGCDTVLRRMNRHYTTEQFQRCVEKIKSRNRRCSIGVDLISGFPGETDAEHALTVELVRQLPINYLHVFPYSKRSGTAAATMDGHVSPAVAKQRASQLREIGVTKQREYMSRFVGSTLEVVVEKQHEGQGRRGISAEYLPVVFSGDDRAGSCVMVKVDALHESAACLSANCAM